MAKPAFIKRTNERSDASKEHLEEAQELWKYLESLDGSDVRGLRKVQQAGGTIYGLDGEGKIQASGPL